MKLAEKGRFAAPPVLPKHAESVSRAIAGWRDVHARTHWLLGDESVVDGADFYVGDHELGHIHLEGEAHIAVPKRIRDALIASGRAKPFRYSPNFVVVTIHSGADATKAAELFKLAYDGLHGVAEEMLVARCGKT